MKLVPTFNFFSTYPQNVKKKKKEVSANIGLWRRHLRRVPVPAAERALRDGRRARVGRRLRGHRCSLEGTANFGRGVYVKINLLSVGTVIATHRTNATPFLNQNSGS